MQKIRLLYLLMALTAVLGACRKNDTTTTSSTGSPVSLTITQTNPGKIFVGDSVKFTVVANSSNPLSKATFSQSLNNGMATLVGSTLTLNGQTTDRFSTEYNTPVGFIGNIKLICTVTDNAGNSDTASISFTTLTDISNYTPVLLGSYKDVSGIGSFFSSSNGQVYTKATAFANQSLIDMIFYWDATNLYTLAAPADAGFGTGGSQISEDSVQFWTTTSKNITTFYDISSITTLSGITYGAQIATAFNGGTPHSPGTLANKLSIGQIIGFQTEAGKYGLAQIEQATGGDANGDGALTLNVVVQK